MRGTEATNKRLPIQSDARYHLAFTLAPPILGSPCLLLASSVVTSIPSTPLQLGIYCGTELWYGRLRHQYDRCGDLCPCLSSSCVIELVRHRLCTPSFHFVFQGHGGSYPSPRRRAQYFHHYFFLNITTVSKDSSLSTTQWPRCDIMHESNSGHEDRILACWGHQNGVL